jgi:hypothetical protein
MFALSPKLSPVTTSTTTTEIAQAGSPANSSDSGERISPGTEKMNSGFSGFFSGSDNPRTGGSIESLRLRAKEQLEMFKEGNSNGIN